MELFPSREQEDPAKPSSLRNESWGTGLEEKRRPWEPERQMCTLLSLYLGTIPAALCQPMFHNLKGHFIYIAAPVCLDLSGWVSVGLMAWGEVDRGVSLIRIHSWQPLCPAGVSSSHLFVCTGTLPFIGLGSLCQ